MPACCGFPWAGAAPATAQTASASPRRNRGRTTRAGSAPAARLLPRTHSDPLLRCTSTTAKRGGMEMNAMNRALMTLLAASATGCLLWLASQFHTGTTGGYWAAMGVIAGGGLLLALAQLRGAGGNPPGMFLLSFL